MTITDIVNTTLWDNRVSIYAVDKEAIIWDGFARDYDHDVDENIYTLLSIEAQENTLVINVVDVSEEG